jgi:transcriptional regulator with XRE-family HTH domain
MYATIYKQNCKMYAMAYTSFASWLEEQLKEQGISQAELARRAGVTRGAINGVLQEARGPGVELSKGIAKALRLPEQQVMRAAGLLAPAPETDEELEQIIHEAEQLNKEDHAEVLAYIRMKNNLRKKKK